MLKYGIAFSFAFMLYFLSCAPEAAVTDPELQFGSLPTTPLHPADNPTSAEKVALGKILFWDPILSGTKDIACVSCHHPKNAYAEDLDLSLGVGGTGLSAARRGGLLVKRNSMTILNTAFNGINVDKIYSPTEGVMFWDNRIKSLEKQAIEPILSAEEMRGTTISKDHIMDTILLRLKNIPEYQAQFKAVFGENGITTENIGKAMATFQRSLIANNSRFDRYANGDNTALNAQEVQGMVNFIRAGCANCHKGPMLSDFDMHVLTVPENSKLKTPDNGSGSFAFRTPSLRNVALTAPYMHNGVFKTLEDVLEFYDEASEDSQNPNVPNARRDPHLQNVNLGDNQVAAIIAFLKTLTDNNFDKSELKTVPSKLPAGGRLE